MRDLDRNIVTSWKRSIGVGFQDQPTERVIKLSDHLEEVAEKIRRLEERDDLNLGGQPQKAIRSEDLDRLKAEQRHLEAVKEKERWLSGLKIAEDTAKLAITNPKIKVIAIVDLYSKRDPVVVEWVYDDSKAVQILERPPQPELGRDLEEFLLWLQRQRGK